MILMNNKGMFGKRKKHQVRIQHQNPSPPKRKFFILLVLFCIGGLLIFYQNREAVHPSLESQNDKKADSSGLTDKDIKKQIQQDYKSNLLKRRMAEDSARYQKKTYISKEASKKSREDYTLKDGVSLSQDESFDELLAVLKTEEETEEDIEDRIARYRIIEEKIQNLETPQDKTSDQESDVDPREIYAQEFIENARRGGYEVKLDKNFKVKSVKKIKP